MDDASDGTTIELFSGMDLDIYYLINSLAIDDVEF